MTEKKSGRGRGKGKPSQNNYRKRRNTGRKRKRTKKHKKNSFLKPYLQSVQRYLKRRNLLLLGMFFSLVVLLYVIYLDFEVRDRFKGRLWSVPSKVYARSLTLAQGMTLNADSFEYELKLMAYEEVRYIPQQPGQYRRWQNNFELISRPFKDDETESASSAIRLEIAANKLVQMKRLFQPQPIESVRLDPALIGSIYPRETEDRQLLKLDDVPERLIKTLIAVEDRSFYEHFGINPLAIMRALWVNLKAGAKRQGGSTLTQQLVKNLFLSPERSYWRKINEAIMALLLELHYDKNSILEAYINEVYLGQNKKASIHGFELGSQFYFDRPLNKLSPEQGALLIGLIKGPSYFNPRRHPERALERRNVVLEVMRDQQVIGNLLYKKSVRKPLAVDSLSRFADRQFPAFIDLVKRQLHSRFSSDELKKEGLQIYTTFDPQVQHVAEQSVKNVLKTIQYRAHDVPLQTAVVITDIKSSAVLALIGGRDAGFRGFNRALDASRQIGSLIKPAIYLAALQAGGTGKDSIHLSTKLDDSLLALKFRDGQVWQPQNYDKHFRGDVILFDALVHSYNVPSVRLGLKIGLGEIVKTLRNLGLQKEVPVYPSMLLGAFELTPFDVASMYQTIAADGHQLGLHSIKRVLSHQGEPLVYFAEEAKYTIEESNVYLVKTALHAVTQQGTAKRLKSIEKNLAGKTGTTDDLRDSWFAGFGGNKLGVVWVGNDDNLATGLTGASGALSVWKDIFQNLPVTSIDLVAPENISFHEVDRKSGLLAGFSCSNTVKLPFLPDRQPTRYADCE